VLQFDSERLPPAERFTAYRDLYAGGTDAEQVGPDFRARVSAWSLDRVTIFERHLNDVGHHRTRAHVASDGFDHYTVTLVLSGEVMRGNGVDVLTVRPGCGLVADTHLPGRNWFRDATLYTLRIARSVFRTLAPGHHDLHDSFTKAGTTALLIDYVRVLLPRLDYLDLVGTGHAVDALFALLRGALQPPRSTAEMAALARDNNRLIAVRASIEASINDPDLGADTIIAQADVSRATLYRLFKPLGGINGYIRTRRLHALRLSLMDAAEQRSFAELAIHFGFRSEAHASRLFFERYDIRPGSYRARWKAEGGEPKPVRQMRFLDATIDQDD
jgi:AraC-like DNA-binding protein